MSEMIRETVMSVVHQPVLLKEAVDGLNIRPNGIYIDATFGRGGHSLEILHHLGPDGRLMALDKDPDAISLGKTGPFLDARFSIVHASFATLQSVVQARGWVGKIDGILFDLGVSSPQLDTRERGFSFRHDGPLDMRMNTEQGLTAAQWLGEVTFEELAQVIREFGEERFAGRIASAIIKSREQAPIESTLQLADIVRQALPAKIVREQKKHPATKTFQAIRIFINNELADLRSVLTQCLAVMSVGGRISAISFHSLEDRIIKRFFQEQAQGDPYPPELPVPVSVLQPQLAKKSGLIRPGVSEIADNPRARSARLRIAEKIA